jgi:hypothetical protein
MSREAVINGAFLVGFILLFLGCIFMLSRVGDWSMLAVRFPQYVSGKPRRTAHMCSGWIGGIPFTGCLTIRVYFDGLRLSVMSPFCLGHRPFFIPWDAMHNVAEEQYMFVFRYVGIDIGDPPISHIQLPGWVRLYIPDDDERA